MARDPSTSPVLNPRDAECFRFLACDYDRDTGTASLSYAFDGGPAAPHP